MSTIYLVFEHQSQGADSISGIFFDLKSAREAILKYIGSGQYSVSTSFNKELYFIGEAKYRTLYIDLIEKSTGLLF